MSMPFSTVKMSMAIGPPSGAGAVRCELGIRSVILLGLPENDNRNPKLSRADACCSCSPPHVAVSPVTSGSVRDHWCGLALHRHHACSQVRKSCECRKDSISS